MFSDTHELRSLNERYTNVKDILGESVGIENFVGTRQWADFRDEKLIVDSKSYGDLLDKKAKRFDGTENRVFISHKQEDKDIAISLAKELDKHGIKYWLDVLDPELSQIANDEIAMANIIELALLNCNHLVAIMTDNSCLSTWIPYEYGRVMEKRLNINQAIALKHNLTNTLPGYMKLGKSAGNSPDLIRILQSSINKSYLANY
jgi:hypothetical protein